MENLGLIAEAKFEIKRGCMKKVIVTGANGFIGSELLKILSDKKIESIAVVRNKQSSIEKIQELPYVRIIYCELDDIHNLYNLVSDRDIDACIYLAWTGSFGDERACYETQIRNVRYALKTVDVIHMMGVRRFIGAGTLAEKEVLNYHSKDGAKPDPVTFYGIAKVAAHFMTKTECTRLQIEHIWCYISNTYAAGSTTDNFAMMASRRMLNGDRAAFTLGEQMYDFMYVTDTASAIYYVADKGKVNVAYYLGSGKQRKLKEYIEIIRDTVNPEIELYLGEIPYHGNPLPAEAYDSSRLSIDTGFKAEIEFEDGIKRTIEWLRDQQQCINDRKQGKECVDCDREV